MNLKSLSDILHPDFLSAASLNY